jgi:hypothetical protein
MIIGDRLLASIFDAIKKEKASPADRRMAVVRAGLVAQMYADDHSLTDNIFGSLDQFEDDDNLNLRSRGETVHGGTH